MAAAASPVGGSRPRRCGLPRPPSEPVTCELSMFPLSSVSCARIIAAPSNRGAIRR